MQPSTIMTIGPAEAIKLLENNAGNRLISDRVVSQYAAEMKAGNWLETGNPINIGAKSGKLLNGQHRLWAIIESGVTLKFHVIYEVDEDGAFATYDTGRVRVLAQLVSIRHPDHTDPTCASSAARLIWMWEHTEPTKKFNKKLIPAKATLVDYASHLLEDPGFDWATRVAHQIQVVRAGRSWYAAALYLIAMSEGGVTDKLQEFHAALISGAGLNAGDPRLALRNYVITRGAAREVDEQRVYMILTVRAWNTYVQGRTIRSLSWREGSAFPEPLPWTAPGTSAQEEVAS